MEKAVQLILPGFEQFFQAETKTSPSNSADKKTKNKSGIKHDSKAQILDSEPKTFS